MKQDAGSHSGYISFFRLMMLVKPMPALNPTSLIIKIFKNAEPNPFDHFTLFEKKDGK
jgi:hypothetical protein